MPRGVPNATKKPAAEGSELEALRKALIEQTAARSAADDAEKAASEAQERAKEARIEAATLAGKASEADDAVVAATEAYGKALAAESD